MKLLSGGAIGLFMLLSAGSAFCGMWDPIWMFADADNQDLIYAYFRYCDTARNGDWLCKALESDQFPDTGDSYDGSKYINFNYQFSSDSLILRRELGGSIILYRDLRPGYAGFKTAWDYGMTGFPIARYKYLVFAHKGPNMSHKVTIRSWYNNGMCGAPSYNEFIGTFAASNLWKVDTIPIPDGLRNRPDSAMNIDKYYELVFIINNLDQNDTTSGPPGCLKIDNIRLAGRNPIDTSPKTQTVNEGHSATFKVYASRADSTDILSYQWKKDGIDIAGADEPVYTIASAKPEHAGAYTAAVSVSRTGLTFASLPATLTVHSDVALQPGAVLKNGGKNAFSIRSVSNGDVLITPPAGRKTPVTISLYSVDGRTLIDRTSGTFEPGHGAFVIGNKMRSKGVYFIKITGADFNLLQQVVVVR